MVSVAKAGALYLNSPLGCGGGLESLQCNKSANSMSPGSPDSWKNSLEELSKNLKRICSQSRESVTPPMSTPGLSLSENSKRNSSENVFTYPVSSPVTSPNGSVALDGKRYVRVRHEESQDILQRRLSQISGFKNSQHSPISPLSSVKNQAARFDQARRASRDIADIAKLVVRRLSSSVNSRVNIVVKTDDMAHENLTVACHNDELIVSDISKQNASVGQGQTDKPCEEVHRECIPAETQVNRLMCVHSDNELHICERSKHVVNLEVSKSAAEDPIFCPVFAWEENMTVWKMSWYLDEKYINQFISIKTIDSKLVVNVRCKRASMQLENRSQSLDENPRNSWYSPNATDITRYRGGIQLSLELPEGVEPRTVHAHVTQINQLIVAGKQCGINERCMTL